MKHVTKPTIYEKNRKMTWINSNWLPSHWVL